MEQNVYTDLNGKRRDLETKQIKSHVFSYLFLISYAFCVFINYGFFYHMLGSIATVKVSKSR